MQIKKLITRKHYKEECEDLYDCQHIKSCIKRHPKCCKQFASGKCRFGGDCSYKHVEPTKNKEIIQVEENLKQLEKITHAPTQKVLSLETEIEKTKKDQNRASSTQEKVKEKETVELPDIKDKD